MIAIAISIAVITIVVVVAVAVGRDDIANIAKFRVHEWIWECRRCPSCCVHGRISLHETSGVHMYNSLVPFLVGVFE